MPVREATTPKMIPADLGLLSQPRNVILLISLYLLLHFILRVSFGPVLGLDDAEQALFAQQWALSYRFEQPPLFTWLLYPTFAITGVNYFALNFWRYFWLGIIFFRQLPPGAALVLLAE